MRPYHTSACKQWMLANVLTRSLSALVFDPSLINATCCKLLAALSKAEDVTLLRVEALCCIASNENACELCFLVPVSCLSISTTDYLLPSLLTCSTWPSSIIVQQTQLSCSHGNAPHTSFASCLHQITPQVASTIERDKRTPLSANRTYGDKFFFKVVPLLVKISTHSFCMIYNFL